MIDIKAIKAAAEAVKGWRNCNQAWLDTSEDATADVVGHIGEDGEPYPVVTVDCDQYFAGGDSLPLAKFYATANPATVLAMCNEIERLRHENGTPLSMLGVGQLRQENDELRRETERLRKDAARQFRDERYWFLRDMDHWPAVFASSDSPEPARGKELDECIDKEMESKT